MPLSAKDYRLMRHQPARKQRATERRAHSRSAKRAAAAKARSAHSTPPPRSQRQRGNTPAPLGLFAKVITAKFDVRSYQTPKEQAA